MRISDWSSDVCSSDLRDQAVEMPGIACLAFDVDIRVLGRQRGEHALVIDLDDVDLMLLEQLHHGEEGARPVLEFYAQPRHAAELGRASCRERVCQYV